VISVCADKIFQLTQNNIKEKPNQPMQNHQLCKEYQNHKNYGYKHHTYTIEPKTITMKLSGLLSASRLSLLPTKALNKAIT
jgi:hypothetical protein